MIPIQRSCDVENLADFSRYYGNSWIGWHPTDAAHISPAFVGGMQARDVVFLRFLSKTGAGEFTLGNHELTEWKSILEHIDFGLPPVGLCVDGPTISYGSYASPRTPKKGYRPNDVIFSYFNNWNIRSKYTRPGRLNYDNVWEVFNPEYKSFPEALASLSKGDVVGIPISRTIGMYTIPKYKYPMLAYKRWTVGYVMDAYTIYVKAQYSDYANEIYRQTGAKVITI